MNGGVLPAHTAAPTAAAAAAVSGTCGDSGGHGISSQTAIDPVAAALLLKSDGLFGPEQEQLLQECNKYLQQRGNNMGGH
jgi:hypothetical protein